MYFVIRKNDQGEYVYATRDAFNLNGARAYANAIDARHRPMVIKDEGENKKLTDEKVVIGNNWLSAAWGFIMYGVVAKAEAYTGRDPDQLKST